MEESFRELRDNLEKGVDLQFGMFVKDIAGAFESRARDETLKGGCNILVIVPSISDQIYKRYVRRLSLRLLCYVKWKARTIRNACLVPERNGSKTSSLGFFQT